MVEASTTEKAVLFPRMETDPGVLEGTAMCRRSGVSPRRLSRGEFQPNAVLHGGNRLQVGAGHLTRLVALSELPLPGFDLKKQKKAERFVPITQAVRQIVGERRQLVRFSAVKGSTRRCNALGVTAQRVPAPRHQADGWSSLDVRPASKRRIRARCHPRDVGVYGEHERDARNAACAAIQDDLGTYGATFPKSATSQRDEK